MLTKSMKWSFIATLLVLAAVNWRSSADYRTVLAALVVCAGAIVVLVQSVGAGKYIWATTSLTVSALFNPAQPISFPRNNFCDAGFGLFGSVCRVASCFEDDAQAIRPLHYRSHASK
jgi:hypothetical protein